MAPGDEPRNTRRSRYLDLDGRLKSLALLLLPSVGLGTHDTTTPVATILLVLVSVALLDGLDELRELVLILRANLGQGKDSGSLLVDDSTETSLALDDGIGDTHLATQCGKEDDELDRVNIIGDEDERSLLVLDETHDMVESKLGVVWLLADILLFLALGDCGGLLLETLLLLRLGLRTILVEELESLGCRVAVEGLLELSDGRGNLQAHVEDFPLALEPDICGPSHHTREVALGLDVLADAEVPRALLDEWVLGLLLSSSPTLREGCWRGFLSRFWRHFVVAR